MRAVGLGGCRPALLGAQQRHLGAHLRAVGGEEGEQRVAAGVAARGAVRPHERRGEVGPARLVELHDEEREVGRDVDPAQRRRRTRRSRRPRRRRRAGRARAAGRRGRRGRGPRRRARSSSSQSAAQLCAARVRSSRAIAARSGQSQRRSVAKLSSSARLTASAPSAHRSLGRRVEARQPRAGRGVLGPGRAGRTAARRASPPRRSAASRPRSRRRAGRPRPRVAARRPRRDQRPHAEVHARARAGG